MAQTLILRVVSSHAGTTPTDPPSSGGKRRPTAPLVTTSDEDEDDKADTPALSSTEYENVSSPGNSSTASGPIYIRPPGFSHHGQTIILSKPKLKKKKTALAIREGLKKRDPTPPKSKPRREPLPMRLRALPQSFWQQPNKPQVCSPASVFPSLPPLCKDDVTEIRPVTPPEDKEKIKQRPKPERKVTAANTDLLFKLFEGIGEADKKPLNHFSTSTYRRGRPRKHVASSTLLSGEDPYLVECVTEKMFPHLSIENSKHYQNSGHSSLQLVTLREGDKSVTLPSLSVEQNYSQMLSELVMQI
ncbi:uncharacterized protein LOC135496905 [Lineus longissimus]|uniref:uncharacterized protein LOC135496905 n=1 Tax=Lineus longissimus TaxID=88925 RepID=UPI00315CBA71